MSKRTKYTEEELRTSSDELELRTRLHTNACIEHDNIQADLNEQIEQFRVQLAGVSVAAMGGTKNVAVQGDYGWSLAYQDTLDLRIKFDALRASNE